MRSRRWEIAVAKKVVVHTETCGDHGYDPEAPPLWSTGHKRSRPDKPLAPPEHVVNRLEVLLADVHAVPWRLMKHSAQRSRQTGRYFAGSGGTRDRDKLDEYLTFSAPSPAPLTSCAGTMSLAPLARVAPTASALRDARSVRVHARSPNLFVRGALLTNRGGRIPTIKLLPFGAVRPCAVLADATIDDLDFEQEKYSWRVGGPNDIPCVHLRDVYKGVEPLEPRPSPFCTKSSCPVTIGDRTPISLNRTFVSEDDRVLLKSMAFG